MKKRSKSRNLDIGCATSIKSCNLALEKMWKREFNFKTGEWGWLLNDISKRTKRSHFYQESTREDKFGLFDSHPLYASQVTKSESVRSFYYEITFQNTIK
ncbi:hypothetical protein EMGBS4_15660 [Acidimicrobiaceae bacterium]|nr:hypothetical protein EMGBS4_15660 [Acidimicrobiaceae bacterium]